MENDWDLSSIVRRCKVTTFTNPSTFCETPPQNLTTTITSTTNSIISPINTSPSCFEDYFIFNQEISPIANKHTMENDWDLSSIVRRCKVTTFTNPSTFCETPPQKLATMVTTTTTNSLEDKLSEDKWRWKKYRRKPIKGSPHLRSYYKCSSFKDCPARKQSEKSETEENTYVVTYRGKHNHPKLEVKQNSNNGTARNKSSEAGLPVVGQAGSSQNSENLGYPNVVMVQFDQSESNNAQVIEGHSKITNSEIELNESQSHVVSEAGSSQNVQKLDSHNKMMLQHDEPERRNAQILLKTLIIMMTF
ncbi:WRKY Transcription Factor [Trifolium repens]|nr:WRKY Transcription Factor [Trifolium repens]